MSSLREDNRRLTKTVTELRADRRVQDRKLRDLQHQLDESHAKLAATVLDGPMPALPVEIAGPTAAATPAPGSARVVGVADDGTEIVYEGEAASTRMTTLPTTVPNFDEEPARRPARAAALPMVEVPTTGDRIEVTRRVPPISARAAVRSKTRAPEQPSDRSGDASGDYRAAVELVKAGKTDDAVTALRAFVTKYPRHDYADNAQYWLGEAFYAQKDYDHALTEFRKVIEVYPRGNKVPDALLKVGYCYQATGQGEKAHAVLQQVVTQYPKSEPATLAAKRLEAP